MSETLSTSDRERDALRAILDTLDSTSDERERASLVREARALVLTSDAARREASALGVLPLIREFSHVPTLSTYETRAAERAAVARDVVRAQREPMRGSESPSRQIVSRESYPGNIFHGRIFLGRISPARDSIVHRFGRDSTAGPSACEGIPIITARVLIPGL